MIDLKANRIVQGEQEEIIAAFEVWWRGPYGLYKDLGCALSVCTENDWDPQLCLKPVVMAVGDTMTEEIP